MQYTNEFLIPHMHISKLRNSQKNYDRLDKCSSKDMKSAHLNKNYQFLFIGFFLNMSPLYKNYLHYLFFLWKTLLQYTTTSVSRAHHILKCNFIHKILWDQILHLLKSLLNLQNEALLTYRISYISDIYIARR